MSSTKKPPVDSVAAHARVATEQERASMRGIISRHDNAKLDKDYDALMETFSVGAICEFKPAGLRLVSRSGILEMYRRTLPKLSDSLRARRQMREWSNQNGLLREWLYPINTPSVDEKFTRQLEIFEFSDDLKSIRSYRVRMNTLYSNSFIKALGEDFASLPGVVRVPG